MFAKTLVRLIDYAIFPAVLIVSAKIIGIVFLAQYFDAQYEVKNFQLVFGNAQDFIAVNSYSSLLMFVAVVAGLLWVVLKAHIFHDTHIKPSFSAQLFNMNLQELIHSNATVFSQSFIWLSYAWLATIMFGVHGYFRLSYWWIFGVALFVSVITTALLVVDLEREVVKDRSGTTEKDPTEGIITFKELKKEVLVS